MQYVIPTALWRNPVFYTGTVQILGIRTDWTNDMTSDSDRSLAGLHCKEPQYARILHGGEPLRVGIFHGRGPRCTELQMTALWRVRSRDKGTKPQCGGTPHLLLLCQRVLQFFFLGLGYVYHVLTTKSLGVQLECNSQSNQSCNYSMFE